jgi:hypothetical protein
VTQHDFRIDEILGATEGDETDLGRHGKWEVGRRNGGMEEWRNGGMEDGASVGAYVGLEGRDE